MTYSAWPTEVEDRDLLEAIIEGNLDAGWTLWQRHTGHLYAVCFAEMRGQKADAEDALAQSMIKAVTKLPVFAGRIVSARAWLRRLTRNVCKDMQREREREKRLAEDVRAVDGQGLRSPNELASGGEWQTCDPTVLLERLPDRLREAFALRVLQQLRYEDIAARLQVTCVTARKRVQQARELLRALREGDVPKSDVRPFRAVPCAAGIGSSDPVTSRVVRVQLSLGTEAEIEILMDHRPLRERQKITTLRAYVERHPRGWKKRLALADLLYETGVWSEAADSYRYVLRKRPWLTAVSARLNEMSRQLEKFT